MQRDKQTSGHLLEMTAPHRVSSTVSSTAPCSERRASRRRWPGSLEQPEPLALPLPAPLTPTSTLLSGRWPRTQRTGLAGPVFSASILCHEGHANDWAGGLSALP